MRPFNKKSKDSDYKEKLVTINTDTLGCRAMKGTWNPKSNQCEVRQDIYKDRPNEVTNRKFETVNRPADMTIPPDPFA